MKDGLENSFKKSLDNYELPYDASAWDSMQAKLDASASNGFEEQMKESLNAAEYPYNPAAWTALENRLDAGKKGGKGKWYVAASIIAVASIATYLLINTDSTKATPEPQSQEKAKTTNTVAKNADNNTSNGVVSNANNRNSLNNNQTASNSGTNSDAASNQVDQNVHSNGTSNNASQETNQGSNTDTSQNDNNQNDRNLNNGGSPNNTGNNPGENPDRAWNYITPAIETLCEGSTVKINNENDYPITIVQPNGLIWSGHSNQSTLFEASIEGTCKVGYMRNDAFVEKESFRVLPAPKADFEFVDLSKIYLDGLPTTEVRATTTGQDFTWKYENGLEKGNEAALHFYNKGVYPVELTVVGVNGCKSTIKKTVNIEENYNLMAQNSIAPLDIDIRNTRFMPIALTIRKDISFTMIILDPRDGHLIYETSDAAEGWDGIDRQTGSMVSFDKNYIWKVTIHNPEKGESTDYAGTVLVLQER